MTKKEKDYKKVLSNKNTGKNIQVRKSWVKASINEIELLKTMGLPFLSKTKYKKM